MQRIRADYDVKVLLIECSIEDVQEVMLQASASCELLILFKGERVSSDDVFIAKCL